MSGSTLDWLGVRPEDRPELIEAGPRTVAEHDLVERAAQAVRDMFGQRGPGPELIRPPNGSGAFERYFTAHVCLRLLPDIRAYHRDRGITDEISAATLRILANNLARHRRIYRTGGLDGQGWVILVFRGLVYHVGRLVFERTYLGPAATALPGRSERDDALGIHIPPTGRLLPAECDAAFADAAEFFARHFPEDAVGLAHCRSWLLDPQLADYLPADSNLVRFAGRFRLLPENGPDDDNDNGDGDLAIVRWVFEAADPADLRALTPTTTLERAVLRHLRAGRHWQARAGWLEL